MLMQRRRSFQLALLRVRSLCLIASASNKTLLSYVYKLALRVDKVLGQGRGFSPLCLMKSLITDTDLVAYSTIWGCRRARENCSREPFRDIDTQER